MLPRKRGLPAILRVPDRPGPSAHRRRWLGLWSKRMTVGIGVLCEGGDCIVLAADTRGSYGDTAHLPTHEQTGKQIDLPFNFFASIAGDVAVCDALVSELYAQFEKLQDVDELFFDHVRIAIREAQLYEFANRVDHVLATTLGTRLDEWKKFEKATLHYRRCQRAIRRYQLPTELIVAGYASSGPVLITTLYNDPPEGGTLATIGSGYKLALELLTERGQQPHMSAQRSMVHVAEALEKARGQKDVGSPADYVVITPKSVRRLPARNEHLMQLMVRYWGRDTEELDGDEVARLKLRDSLYFVRKEERKAYPTQSTSQTSKDRRSPYAAAYQQKGRHVFDD